MSSLYFVRFKHEVWNVFDIIHQFFALLSYDDVCDFMIIDDILLYCINCIIACAFALFMNVLVDIVTGNSYLAPNTAKCPVLNSDFFDIVQTVAIFTSRIMSPPPPCTVHR